MKQGSIVALICVLFFLAPIIHAEEKITIKMPFAFQDKFQEDYPQLGFPEGKVLQLGFLVKASGSPITQVTAKNLNSGVVLTPTPMKIGVWSGLYIVDPMPPFNPSKHLGVWEFQIQDEKGNEAVAKTHKLDDYGELPYIKGIKATGKPPAPLISWSAIDETNIPENIYIRYQVRLVTDFKNQFHRSEQTTETKYQVPENLIKTEDLSKIYIRVDTLGYDKTDSEHSVPFEASSRSLIPLKEALGKK